MARPQFAIDGSTLRVPDSQANEQALGRPGSSRSESAYPQMRLVAMLAVGSRILVDFRAGSYSRDLSLVNNPDLARLSALHDDLISQALIQASTPPVGILSLDFFQAEL